MPNVSEWVQHFETKNGVQLRCYSVAITKLLEDDWITVNLVDTMSHLKYAIEAAIERKVANQKGK